MSWPLVRKELREHGVVLALLFLLDALLLPVLLVDADKNAGRFSAYVRFVGVFGVFNAMVFASRLLVREYAGRTQLFLEVLPVSRARVFATKWVLGFLMLQLLSAAAWAATYAWVSRNEVIALAGALATLGSVSLFAACLWSFAALAGTLGRYRYVAWLAVSVAIGATVQITGTPLFELPVLRLLGEDVDMALGRPTNAEFLQAAAFGAACIVIAPLLALAGSGAIASALAQRMAVRERVFLIACVLGIVALFEVLEPRPVKPPFKFTTEQQVLGEHARVGIMETVDLDPTAADALARIIAADVESLIDQLGWDVQPTIFIQPQRGLDPTAMQRAYLGEQDGIVLRAAPDAPRDTLRAFVLHELLMDATSSRGHREDRHVLFDGFAAYWALRDDPQGRELWRLRALAAKEVSEATLQQWSLTSERLGECVSQGIAFLAVDVLFRTIGEARAMELMRALVAEPQDDVRVLFEPEPATLLTQAGIPWPKLVDRMKTERDQLGARLAEVLDSRPVVQARIDWVDDDTGGSMRATVVGSNEYRVLYRELLPWTADVVDLMRLDVRGATATVPVSPAKGSRWLAAIELDDPILRCPVRVFAKRMIVP